MSWAKIEILVVLTLAAVSLSEAIPSGERIVGGQIAAPHSIPFQVALIVKSSESNDLLLCGGSLINENTVVTAAHCLHNKKRAVVVLGAHDLMASNETGVERQIVNTTSFRIHPNFSLAYANLDIALVLLPTPVNFSDSIQAVNLPSGYQVDELFAGDIGTVSGFGQFCDDCGSSNVLRFTQNRIMGNTECSKLFTFNAVPSSTQVCLATSESMSGNCRGDSGGPLTIIRNKEPLLVGLSSFGFRKCEDGKPTVFTRLNGELVSWINDEMEKS